MLELRVLAVRARPLNSGVRQLSLMNAMKLLVSISIIFSLHGAALSQQAESPVTSPFINVSFCDLIRSPQQYDNKVVRLKAIYAVNFEWVLLYDCQCSEKSYIDPDTSGNNDEASQKLRDVISNNLRFSQGVDRVGLVVKGLFLAPRPNPKIREVGNDLSHLKIMEIEKVFKVKKDIPAPDKCKAKVNSKALSNKSLNRTRN